MDFVMIDPGFNVADVALLESILKNADPFVKGPLPDVDKYDLRSYVFASEVLEKELLALIDNNLLTRICELANKGCIPADENAKKPYIIASAVMGFLIASGFLIEPSMAIYEKASKSGHDAAIDDLINFRIADHIHPQQWFDLALKRKCQIDIEEIDSAKKLVAETQPEIKEGNFSKTLDVWKLNYCCLLKAAQLWRQNNDDASSAISFIEWMESDSYFNAVAAMFTLIFYSPRRFGKMLKGSRTKKGQELIDMLKNAAWDLSYIRQWAKKYRESNDETFWLLCSNDIALKGVAGHIFEDPTVGEADLRNIMLYYWGKKKGDTIFDTYILAYQKIEKDQGLRNTLLQMRFNDIDQSLLDLEAQLL